MTTTQRSNYRTYPAGSWEHYLLELYPERMGWAPGFDVTKYGDKLHSQRRDSQGRFNDLEAGKPALNRAFVARLSGYTWQQVADTIAEVRKAYPVEMTVLDWHQKRYKLTSRDAFADALGTSPSNLSRLLRRGMAIVRQELPPLVGEG